MPEGPEVTVIREGLNSLLQGHQIFDLEILTPSRFSKKAPIGYRDFIDSLPTRIENVNSKGKFIYFKFTNGWVMFNTLGMSGGWYHKQKAHSALKLFYSSRKNKVDKPQSVSRPEQITEYISKKKGDSIKNNKILFFVDQRRFGNVKFVQTQQELDKKLNTLGPDILNDSSLTFDIYKSRMRKYDKKYLVWAMMEQKIISGIGNYLKSEILYQSRISPHVLVQDLPDDKLRELYDISKQKINDSYKARGASVRHYSDIEDRKGVFEFQFQVYNQKKDQKGNKVIREKTKDKRTTHWVPSVQTDDFINSDETNNTDNINKIDE